MNQSSNRKYLAYVRVSSEKQTSGTSLAEQRDCIERYAESNGLTVATFYEEVESASRAGRTKFDEIVANLRKGDYRGIIFHKVDRSARNPKDQALLYELMLEGYELCFAGENITTSQPLGRNMIYMLWGMASGYTENLKAEINKGILGRLKQGRIASAAPIGYLKAEECRSVPDPVKAPLVRQLFTDYASGAYSVQMLVKRAKEIGLVNIHGRPLSKNSIHATLRQTFYYGLITHKKGVFQGEHEPLITKAVFDKVQYFLEKNGFKRTYSHIYTFGGLLKCPLCKTVLKSMTAKKKWKYYYCRNRTCSIKALSEKWMDDQSMSSLKEITLNDEELAAFKKALKIFHVQTKADIGEQKRAIKLESESIEVRLESLVIKLADEKIDDESYGKIRKRLLDRQLELRERRTALEATDSRKFAEMEQFGKLLKNPAFSYEIADSLKKRKLILSMVENLELRENELVFHWKKPFQMIANRPKPDSCAPGRNRTCIVSFGGIYPIH